MSRAGELFSERGHVGCPGLKVELLLTMRTMMLQRKENKNERKKTAFFSIDATALQRSSKSMLFALPRGSPAAPSKALPPVASHRKCSIVVPPNGRAPARRRRASVARVLPSSSSPPTADDLLPRGDADAAGPPSSSSPSSTPPPAKRRLPRSLSFRVASPGADLRAAASLRALAFSTDLLGAGSSSGSFAREAWVRVRSREAWDALEARAAGTDEDYRGCECLCLLGTIEDAAPRGAEGGGGGEEGEEEEDDEEDAALARAARAEGDASCTLPADADEADDDDDHSPGGVLRRRRGRQRRRRRLAVASLDIIVGARLPSESLVAAAAAAGGAVGAGGGAAAGGAGGERGTATAYFANVSVAPAARRRGLGVALLSEAIALVAASSFSSSSSSGGASSTSSSSPPTGPPPPSRIAVHAEARNVAARALYEHPSLGFELEQEEGLEVESRKGRPRRVLYSRPVVLPSL